MIFVHMNIQNFRHFQNYPFLSLPVHFDINSDENLFLAIDIIQNRYFNIDPIINFKNTNR